MKWTRRIDATRWVVDGPLPSGKWTAYSLDDADWVTWQTVTETEAMAHHAVERMTAGQPKGASE